MFDKLKKDVFRANKLLKEYNLVTLTWGNASQIDRNSGVIAIKPSGVGYDKLKVDDIVIVDLNGNIREGDNKPSSDTASHIELYNHFQEIGGVVHAHSKYATIFAQAAKEIPCFGTTHADTFFGTVPLTRKLTKQEVSDDYEKWTGTVIAERFLKGRLKPLEMPGVLVYSHGPFSWGKNALKAVENALILEYVAEMALFTRLLNSKTVSIDPALLNKHYSRKHGKDAYYGQPVRKKK
ncbi:MAG: L-ribulose-5-phosphate 4-epimerase AraD [bacterium]